MGKMMRSLLPSRGNENQRKGRNSSPSVGTAPATAITSLPLGSTDGTGVKLHGVLSGIETQTQWQRTKDWFGAFRDVAPRSYSIRGSRIVTNMLVSSNNFGNSAVWGGGPEAVVGATNILAPDGTLTATNFRETTTVGPNWPRLDQAVPFEANVDYNEVVYFQAAGRPYFYLYMTDGISQDRTVWFDTATGQVANNTGVLNVTNIKSVAVGGGWFRASFTMRFNLASGTGIYSMGPTTTPTGKVGLGDGVSGVNLWKAGVYKYAQQTPQDIVTGDVYPATTCYDTLEDGTPLRPSYVFDQTMRYDIFRPTELARNMAFNVDECIEAVSSDGIRRYFKSVGLQLATNPEFTSDTAWTKGAGWAITGGAATITNPASQTDLSQLMAGVTVGKTYTYTIVVTAGNLTGANINVLGSWIGAGTSGTFTGQVTAAVQTVFARAQAATGTWSIDSISIVEVPAVGSGTTGATSPTFPPSGQVIDGTVVWEAVGYATLIGLELAPVGDGGHPEGVLARIDGVGNFLSQDMVVALDAFADISESTPAFQLGNTSVLSFRESANIVSMRSASNAQVRTSTFATPIGAFDRIVGRYAATAMTLFNYGGTFTGAAGANITVPANAYLGWIGADSAQFSGCILNFCVLTSASLSDANAALRSDWDLKPSVGLLASGTFQTQV